MDYRHLLSLIAVVVTLLGCVAQHEDVPYQDVKDICETCVCLTAQDADKRYHHTLSCAMKKFTHILARWPAEFAKNHNDVDIVATFSGNSIELLQQLPATNASLTFSCRHCGLRRLQVPTFMDVPNIARLDLSWNEITSEELTPEVFRGRYRVTHYEPIALVELDLSHNQLHSLHKELFLHTPNLTKLSLSYNNLKELNGSSATALASVVQLQMLDLSSTGIYSVPAMIFKSLVELRVLNLADNGLLTVPGNLQMIGRTLDMLNLAGNPIARFTEQSFLGLKQLKRLNISDMHALSTIEKSAFTRLETLEYLECTHNDKLTEFDLQNLLHCNNLTQLNLSYCAITTLSLPLDDSSKKNTSDLPRPWPKLRNFETFGNPWLCDCGLLQTLEYIGSHHNLKDTETRCVTPYYLAGAPFSNLTAQWICNVQIPKKYKAIDEDPPRFLRKRYIILTVVTAAVVVSVGVMLGFIIACIRRRLKRDDFGVEPIRYTSVRSSNLSAFSHINANTLENKDVGNNNLRV